MRLLGQILLVCVLISALQALAAVIVITLILVLVWGLIYRTREIAGLLMVSLLIEGLQVHPVVTIGLIILLFGVVLIARAKPLHPEKPVVLLPKPPSPTD